MNHLFFSYLKKKLKYFFFVEGKTFTHHLVISWHHSTRHFPFTSLAWWIPGRVLRQYLLYSSSWALELYPASTSCRNKAKTASFTIRHFYISPSGMTLPAHITFRNASFNMLRTPTTRALRASSTMIRGTGCSS